MTGEIPITRNTVSTEKAEAIRAAVRSADGVPPTGSGITRLAELSDAPALLDFFSDPAVHAPIYSIPRPLTEASVAEFIQQNRDEQARGEGLLSLSLDPSGKIAGYSDFQFWPQWGAGELAGALRSDRQGQGQGGRGILTTFDWMFDVLGLELICSTAALDNVRTARMLDGLGFTRMGEVESTRPDGTVRRSLVWEMTKAEWDARAT